MLVDFRCLQTRTTPDMQAPDMYIDRRAVRAVDVMS